MCATCLFVWSLILTIKKINTITGTIRSATGVEYSLTWKSDAGKQTCPSIIDAFKNANAAQGSISSVEWNELITNCSLVGNWTQRAFNWVLHEKQHDQTWACLWITIQTTPSFNLTEFIACNNFNLIFEIQLHQIFMWQHNLFKFWLRIKAQHKSHTHTPHSVLSAAEK